MFAMYRGILAVVSNSRTVNTHMCIMAAGSNSTRCRDFECRLAIDEATMVGM